MSIIEAIAERIAAIDWADLPPQAVQWAKLAILDTVGVTLAGAGEDCARIVAQVLVSGAFRRMPDLWRRPRAAARSTPR